MGTPLKEIENLLNQGQEYTDIEDYERAVECYKKAVEIDPKDDRVWYNLVFTYDKLKNYEKAIECCKKVVEINPNHYDAWHFMGLLYEELKNYKEQLKCYKKVIAINPEYLRAWYNMGVMFWHFKNYEKIFFVKRSQYTIYIYNIFYLQVSALPILEDESCIFSRLEIFFNTQSNNFVPKAPINFKPLP